MPDPGFHSGRPGFVVEGQPRDDLGAGLIELVVEDSLVGPSGCRATFVNWGPGGSGAPGYLHFDRSVLDLARRFTVTSDAGTGSGKIFDGVITALEGGFPRGAAPVVTVHAQPRLHAFQSELRTRNYPNMNDVDVLRLIAGENGLGLRVAVDQPSSRVPSQKRTSDLAFVLSRARALRAEAWIVDSELQVQTSKTRPQADLSLGIGSNLLEASGTWGAASTGRVTVGTRPFRVVAGVSATTPEMHTGQRLRLTGVGELLEGQYYVTRVNHRFDPANGHSQWFEGERVAD